MIFQSDMVQLEAVFLMNEIHRKGQYAISVNKQWRVCFKLHDGNAYNVEISDYH